MDSDLPGNLPAPLSSFIGRQREIADIRRALTEQRLVTLTGPGGCGKTRLAIRAASDLIAAFPDGVWFVELASLIEPGLVDQALASALGVLKETANSVVTTLSVHLRNRQTLIVLDNCEHLIDACAHLCRILLENCPGIRILATSREPLGVPGEMIRVVPPLTLPEPQPWQSPTSAQISLSTYQQSEAIQLFVERAIAAAPDFSLTVQNAAWVANICRHLDGIPLAIELAAIRVRAFSPRQIAMLLDERQDDRFQLLSGGLRTAPARQQTLEAAIDWSHALLSKAEQQVFRRLAVFTGGWMMAAAEQVCSSESDGINVITNLSNLVDKSLITVDHFQNQARYRYLETIRQYAWHKLDEAGETETIRDRHLQYFTQWAEHAEAQVAGPDQLEWVERFSAEHDNLRAALEWCLSGNQRAELGLRLATACGYFWKIHGYFNEGRKRLKAVLDHPAPQPSITRVRALLWISNLTYLQSAFPAVRPYLEEALALSRMLGPAARLETARTLDLLGELATEVGEHEKAPPFFEEALAIYRELGDQNGTAEMILQLGWAAMRVGDYPRATTLLNQGLPLLKKLGETRQYGFALAGLGEMAVRQGQYEQAIDLLKQSLVLRRELGDRWGIAASLGSLGWAALLRRDFDGMREELSESLALRVELGESGGTAWCLEKLAQGISLEAQYLPTPFQIRGCQRAAQLLGAAQALRMPVNSTIDPADLAEHETLLEGIRARLGQKAFEAAWAEGGILPVAEIIEKSIQPLLNAEEIASLSAAHTAKARYGGLSAREREAALLIAQGKVNHEIARIMFVRVRTVETYVTRILNKLGFESRAQIVAWVYETGLTDEENFSFLTKK